MITTNLRPDTSPPLDGKGTGVGEASSVGNKCRFTPITPPVKEEGMFGSSGRLVLVRFSLDPEICLLYSRNTFILTVDWRKKGRQPEEFRITLVPDRVPNQPSPPGLPLLYRKCRIADVAVRIVRRNVNRDVAGCTGRLDCGYGPVVLARTQRRARGYNHSPPVEKPPRYLYTPHKVDSQQIEHPININAAIPWGKS